MRSSSKPPARRRTPVCSRAAVRRRENSPSAIGRDALRAVRRWRRPPAQRRHRQRPLRTRIGHHSAECRRRRCPARTPIPAPHIGQQGSGEQGRDSGRSSKAKQRKPRTLHGSEEIAQADGGRVAGTPMPHVVIARDGTWSWHRWVYWQPSGFIATVLQSLPCRSRRESRDRPQKEQASACGMISHSRG